MGLSDIGKIQRAHAARAVILRASPSISGTIAREIPAAGDLYRGDARDVGGARAGSGADNQQDPNRR